jgi:hypothetical protein
LRKATPAITPHALCGRAGSALRFRTKLPLDVVDELEVEIEQLAQEAVDEHQVLLAVRQLSRAELRVVEPAGNGDPRLSPIA